MRVKIEVTRYCILQGRNCNGMRCPIALAVNKAFRRNDAFVSDDITFLHHEEPISIPLPKKAKTFIEHFDDGGKKAVKPFSFVVNTGKIKLK